MKVIEITPVKRTRLYGILVGKQAAIQKNRRGTFVRSGGMRGNSARWTHKGYGGSVQLKRGAAEDITAKIRAAQPENERKLLSSFLKFVDRYSQDQVETIIIRYG